MISGCCLKKQIMSAANILLFYLILARYIALTKGVPGQFDPFKDDEDLTQYAEFSGSGDFQTAEESSPRQTDLTFETATIDLNSGSVGAIVQLKLPNHTPITLQDSRYHKNTSTGVGPVRVTDGTAKTRLTSVNNKKLEKSKLERKPEKQTGKAKASKKQKKKKRVNISKTKKKNGRKNKQNRAKTINLGTSGSETVLLKTPSKRKKAKESQKDYHIRGNIISNNHQDNPKHRKHHNRGKHEKRWRKNMESNSHGFGTKSKYKKRKLTFEDRWPGCFKKYESCYRDNNCCNSNCQQFSWLSFGFCL